MNKKLIFMLEGINACQDGIDYIKDQSAIEAWKKCERGDHMLWIAKKQGVHLKTLTLAKVRCARLVEHLMKDQRSINALKVAEDFALGSATLKDLKAAYAAAYAAYAAGAAGAASTEEEILKKCADICRETMPFELLNLSEY